MKIFKKLTESSRIPLHLHHDASRTLTRPKKIVSLTRKIMIRYAVYAGVESPTHIDFLLMQLTFITFHSILVECANASLVNDIKLFSTARNLT